MSKILSLLAGIPVHDTQCGFRLLRRELVEKINLTSMKFEIESEILIEATRLTKGICSIPIASIYRNEKSKIKPIRDTLRFLKLMFRIMAANLSLRKKTRGEILSESIYGKS
jgi:ferredoxin-fold anticodon binding domain-containing protein